MPSLPGYAFSARPPLDQDFKLQDVARLMNKLMVVLGFGSGYAVQGGQVNYIQLSDAENANKFVQ